MFNSLSPPDRISGQGEDGEPRPCRLSLLAALAQVPVRGSPLRLWRNGDDDVAEIVDDSGCGAFRGRRHGDGDFGDAGAGGGDELVHSELTQHGLVWDDPFCESSVDRGDALRAGRNAVDSQDVIPWSKAFGGDEPAFGIWIRGHDAGSKELNPAQLGGSPFPFFR